MKTQTRYDRVLKQIKDLEIDGLYRQEMQEQIDLFGGIVSDTIKATGLEVTKETLSLYYYGFERGIQAVDEMSLSAAKTTDLLLVLAIEDLTTKK